MIDDLRYHMDHIRTQMRGAGFLIFGLLVVSYISISGAQKLHDQKPAWVVAAAQNEKSDEAAPAAPDARMQMLAARLNEIEPQ